MLRRVADYHVLLIEDSLADAELIRVALGRLPFDIALDHAYTGQEALQQYKATIDNLKQPSVLLVLLDLSLPGTDSFALLDAFREAAPHHIAPVVVFSGTGDPATIRKVLRTHARAFVSKSGDLEQFMQRVSRIVEVFLSCAEWPML